MRATDEIVPRERFACLRHQREVTDGMRNSARPSRGKVRTVVERQAVAECALDGGRAAPREANHGDQTNDGTAATRRDDTAH